MYQQVHALLTHQNKPSHQNPLLPSVLTEGVFLLNNSVFVLDLLARNCNQRFQLILLQTGLLFLTDPKRLKVKRFKYQKQ